MLKFALALAATLAIAAPARAEPPVWVIRDADSTIVLFGSVHLLPQALDWAPAKLKAALAQADDLWFETPMDDAAAAEFAASAAERGYLPSGKTLRSMLDRQTARRLERVCGKLGLSIAVVDHMQPWMAEVQVSVAFAARSGADREGGVETRINAMASPKAPRRAFETLIQQLELFAGETPANQIASLKETLREVETDPGAFDRLMASWMTGDVAAMTKAAIDPMRAKTPRTYRRLVVDRNAAWIPQIEARLAGSGETVMVVGAGHLIGPDGVPAMLRKRGVKVEGP